MSHHRETVHIDGPFERDAPIERLAAFYRANGYEVIADDEERPDDNVDTELDEGRRSVQLRRGKRGASWWTSNMARLFTRVEATRVEHAIRITYEIDVTGQLLNENERSFWRREARQAGYYAQGARSEPQDLREHEARRARNQRRSRLSYALWGALSFFIFFIVLGMLGLI